MSKLSVRLKKIFDLVSQRNIADVGCDHGKLSYELFEKGKIDFAYISDISESSLNKAIQLLGSKYPYTAICCDGLVGYPIDAMIEECIISGMGGEEIKKIISNSELDIYSYILSPQHNEIELKQYMLSIGYDIVYDKIVLDRDKFYHIFKCQKSDSVEPKSEFELYFGKNNFIEQDLDFDKYLDVMSDKCKKILEKNTRNSEKWEKFNDLIEIAKKERK